jgi:hypothetical protein
LKNRGIAVIRLAVSFAGCSAAFLASFALFSASFVASSLSLGNLFSFLLPLFVILLLRAAVHFVEGSASGHAAGFCSLLRRHSSLSRALAAAKSLFH